MWVKMLAYLIHLVFLTYTILLFVRIMGSWFPAFAHHKVMRFMAFYTDPYLNVFRKIIPPIGGTLDLSPLIAYFVLQFLEGILIYFVR